MFFPVILCGMLCISTGLLLFLKPEWQWKMPNRWLQVRRTGNPPTYYLRVVQFGGLLLIAVGLLLIVCTLIGE